MTRLLLAVCALLVLAAPARADVHVSLEPAQRTVPVRSPTTYIVTVTTDSPVTLSDVVLLLPGHGQPCGQPDEPGYPYGGDPTTNFQVLSPEPIVTGRWVTWPGSFTLSPDSSYEWDLDVLTPSVAACFYAGASAHIEGDSLVAHSSSADELLRAPDRGTRAHVSLSRQDPMGPARARMAGLRSVRAPLAERRADRRAWRLRNHRALHAAGRMQSLDRRAAADAGADEATRTTPGSSIGVVGVAQGGELDVGQHDEFSTGGYFTGLGANRYELHWWTSASADSLMTRERLGLPAGFTLVSSTLGDGKRRKSPGSFSYQWDTPRPVPAGDYERESVVVDAPCSQLGSTIHARLRVWRSDGLVAGTGDGPELQLPPC